MASVGRWVTRALAAVGLAALAGFVAGLLRPRPQVTDQAATPGQRSGQPSHRPSRQPSDADEES